MKPEQSRALTQIMNKYKRWSNPEKEDLETEYIKQGLPVEEIALKHKRSENSIRLQVSRMGLRRNYVEFADTQCYGLKFDIVKCLEAECKTWLSCCNLYYQSIYGVK